MRELRILKSDRFCLYVAFLTVIFLSPNCYYVYYSLCVYIEPWREIVSGGVAAILAFSIMYYTVKKNIQVAEYLAYFEVMTASYYYIQTIMSAPNPNYWSLIPGLGFAMILPYTLSQYSKEIESERSIKTEPQVNVEKSDMSGLLEFMDKNPGAKPADYFKKNQ